MATPAINNSTDVISLVTSSSVAGQSSPWSMDNGADNSTAATVLTSMNTTGVFINSTSPSWSNFDPMNDGSPSDSMSPKDETLFVALVIMGGVVPAIFIFSFFMIFWRRYKEQRQRREQMLLQNSQDVPMDTIPYSMQARLEAGVL